MIGAFIAFGVSVHFHDDISSTPQLSTNASGNLLWKESYSAYGSLMLNLSGGADDVLCFAGKGPMMTAPA